MNANTLRRSASPGPMAWLLVGGVVMGSLDILFVLVFWASSDITLTRVFQSIAAGVLGKASHGGGAATAWLGAGLHYFIATMMVTAYWLVARRHAGLMRRPVLFGLPYGLLLYGVMNFVVLPLSAAGMPKLANPAWIISSIVMHAAFGVTCAVFARRALVASRH